MAASDDAKVNSNECDLNGRPCHTCVSHGMMMLGQAKISHGQDDPTVRDKLDEKRLRFEERKNCASIPRIPCQGICHKWVNELYKGQIVIFLPTVAWQNVDDEERHGRHDMFWMGNMSRATFCLHVKFTCTTFAH